MQLLSKTWAVAFNEFKMLKRSMLYKLFLLFTIIILVFLNYIFFINRYSINYWAISSSIPIMNTTIINLFQTFIAVFLATEFLKRDKILNCTDSIYSRSMTNTEYVIGKTLGFFALFMFVNIALLLAAFIVNTFYVDDTTVAPIAYFSYLLLINIPTIIYISGISFICMGLFKNQQITITLIIGYVAGTLFFINKGFPVIFDFIAYNLPFTYSDITGFGDIGSVLLHRGTYFFIGLGLIFATVFRINRLPQSEKMNRISLILSISFICIGFIFGSVYNVNISKGKSLRHQMNLLNEEYVESPKVSILSCKIDLLHKGKKIEVNANIEFQNNNSAPIKNFILSLNPGLKIKEIIHHGRDLPFKRDKHIISISLPSELNRNESDSLAIHYTGKINEEACFIDIEEIERKKYFRHFYNNIKKRFSFILPEYVLLVSENLWYPVSGVHYVLGHPETYYKDFTQFELKVKTENNLTAISQGDSEKTGEGEFVFRPEYPLPKISLVIGDYEKKSILVDNTDYNIFVKTGHDYFSQHFNEIMEDLPEEIREIKQGFENRMDLTYPYKRFSIIEVPVQFYAFDREWNLSQETIQPEQVFLPEKSSLIRSGDFELEQYLSISDNSGSNADVTETKEAQKISFRYFFKHNLTPNHNKWGENYYSFNKKYNVDSTFARFPEYDISSQFTTFVNNIYSENYPIFNFIMEHYYRVRNEGVYSGVQYPWGKTAASRALNKQSMSEILSDPSQKKLFYFTGKMKSEFLFTLIKSQIGKDAFDSFIREFLETNRFRKVDLNEFIESLNRQFSFDLSTYLGSWYAEKQLPGFKFNNLKYTEFVDSERTNFQVSFNVYNSEPVPGVFSITIYMKNFEGQEEHETRVIFLEGNQAKQIGIVLDFQPRVNSGYFNTFLSLTVPTVFALPMAKMTPDNKIDVLDGERIIEPPQTVNESGEIIVDNLDPGFTVLTQPKIPLLMRIMKKSELDGIIKNINLNKIPISWQEVMNPGFYGIYSKSAHLIQSGDGDQRVEWKTEISETGRYDIYYFMPFAEPLLNNYKNTFFGDLNIIIYHDDGIDEVPINLLHTSNGWAYLGTYSLPQGTAKVELTDKSNGKIVYADAVKWVKKLTMPPETD